MKVVMIHGQGHKGSTYMIGRMIADKMCKEEDIVEFFLPRDLKQFCVGCYACIDDETKCPFYEEKNRIMREVEKADILIFTTPTYCLHESAALKSFFELTFTYWMPHKPRACMFGKKAIVVSTAAGNGAKKAVKDVADALFYWGVPYVETYGICIQAMNWDGILDKKKHKIEKDTTKIANRVAGKKNVKVGFKTKMMFSVMRMMQKANLGSGAVERAYWEEKGWLNQGRPWKDGK